MKKIINLFVMAALLMAGFRSFAQNNHEYVDLGLPSGTLWATCNVGANSPEEYGDYFAWGETEPKTIYSRSNYGYSNADAAKANWDSDWCMPTKEQWEELRKNTTNKWTTRKGVNGLLFIASNGNSLFLPAAGFCWDDELGDVGSYGDYWSSSLGTDSPNGAWLFYFGSDYYIVYNDIRRDGRSVRAVRSARQN